MARAPKDPNAPAKVPTPAARKTTAEDRATAKVVKNPITGGAPNTFTQTTNRGPLPEAQSAAEYTPNTKLQQTMTRASNKKQAEGGTGPDVGYRAPEGMSGRNFHWLTGAHHDADPNVGTMSDINHPHAVEDGSVVMRRAEDLSGPEHRRATAVAREAGVTSRVRDANNAGRLERSSVEASLATPPGAPRQNAASSRFYQGPSEFEDVTSAMGNRIADHPKFPDQGSQENNQRLGRQMAAMGIGQTSPRTTAVQDKAEGYGPGGKGPGNKFPNQMAAESAAYSALEGTPAKRGQAIGRDLHERGNVLPTTGPADKVKGVGVLPDNVEKARHAIVQMADGVPMHEVRNAPSEDDLKKDPNAQGRLALDPIGAPKAAPFTTALAIKHAHPDAFSTDDVWKSSTTFAHTSSKKAVGFNEQRPDGSLVESPSNRKNAKVHMAHGDETFPGGDNNNAPKALHAEKEHPDNTLIPATETDDETGRVTRKRGNTRHENVLSTSGFMENALDDHSMRRVQADAGFSPGTNNAGPIHRTQGAIWGSEKIANEGAPDTMHTAYGNTLGDVAHVDHAWSSAAQAYDHAGDVPKGRKRVREHGPASSIDALSMATRHSDYRAPLSESQFPHTPNLGRSTTAAPTIKTPQPSGSLRDPKWKGEVL